MLAFTSRISSPLLPASYSKFSCLKQQTCTLTVSVGQEYECDLAAGI